MVMLKCLTKKYVNCCICYDLKKNYVKCIKCKNSHICYNCITNMIEHGISNKCPLCQQVEWRDKNIKKNIVIPMKISLFKNYSINDHSVNVNDHSVNVNDHSVNVNNKMHICEKCYWTIICITRVARVYFIIFIFSYVLGLFTMAIFGPPINFVWVPLVIGLCEMIFIFCCCIGCCDNNNIIRDQINCTRE